MQFTAVEGAVDRKPVTGHGVNSRGPLRGSELLGGKSTLVEQHASGQQGGQVLACPTLLNREDFHVLCHAAAVSDCRARAADSPSDGVELWHNFARTLTSPSGCISSN